MRFENTVFEINEREYLNSILKREIAPKKMPNFFLTIIKYSIYDLVIFEDATPSPSTRERGLQFFTI
jgi:hypothetical protein